MNISYISAKVQGSTDLLSTYILNKYPQSQIKSITDTIVFFQFHGPPPYVDLVTPNLSRGFTIIECSQIKESDWKNNGLDFINKVEADDKSDLTPEEKKLAEENEKAYNEIKKILVDTVLPAKAPLTSNDPCMFLSSSNYVFSFVATCLLLLILTDYLIV